MTRDKIISHCVNHGYSKVYMDYWLAHPLCQVCTEPSVAPHHMKTRGAGGKDTPENLLALCILHDRMIHNCGDIQFGREVGGAIQAKIMAVKHARLTTP